MTRLWWGSLAASVGTVTFTGSVMEEIFWLWGPSSAFAFFGLGILLKADQS